MDAPRRTLLRNAALITFFTAVPWLARGQSKATKKAMQYQDQPKNGQKCSTCVQFVPGAQSGGEGTCKVVDGPISPNGWCMAYVKKS
jgi:hypothetical protein